MSANVEKHATLAQIFGVETRGLSSKEIAYKGVGAARDLNKDIGIPLRLRDVGVPKEALDEMAAVSMEAGRLLSQNPRPISAEDVRQIWDNAW